MIRDYSLTSPSLEGILLHESVSYEGLKRPVLLNRIFDKPSGMRVINPDEMENKKIIEDYFRDLYGVLVKKLSQFVIDSETNIEESVKITAMLHELIKVKKLLAGKRA